MDRQRAQIIFYVVLGLTGAGMIGFAVWSVYFILTSQ